MTSNDARLVLGARPAGETRTNAPPWWRPFSGKGRAEARRLAGQPVRGVLLGGALVLLGAVAGLSAGHVMARSAHHTGACVALNMAAALGYLDDQQRRQVVHALATALNPDVDLFPGGSRAIRQACKAGAS